MFPQNYPPQLCLPNYCSLFINREMRYSIFMKYE